MADFRLCSTCQSRSQAGLCHCTQRPISDRSEPTIARLRYSLGGDRPSQTAHHALSRLPMTEPSPRPESADPMTNVRAMICPVGTPIKDAVSCECETARMAIPSLVFKTIHSSANIKDRETPSTRTCWLLTDTPATVNKTSSGMMGGKTRGLAPQTTCPRFSRRRNVRS